MVINGNKRQKIPKTKENLTIHHVTQNLITSGTVRLPMRRSVTIDPALHEYIIKLRGWLGMEKGLDVDYTTVLNTVAKLGALRINEWDNLTSKEKEEVSNTLQSSPEQQIEYAADEWWTKHLKVQMPAYDPEPTQEEPESNSNSVTGKEKDETPEKG